MTKKKAGGGTAEAKLASSSLKSQEIQKDNDVARWGFNLNQSEQLDDWSSEWKEVLSGNGTWGGRKRGGRGISKITGMSKDISVEGITLAFCGKELLQRTSLKLMHNHRYGLIGDNGVGKSTLLRRIASQSIPGIPLHFRYGYVQQELPLYEDMKVLDYILNKNDTSGSIVDQLKELRQEEAELDKQMEETNDTETLSLLAEQLSLITDEIDTLEAKQNEMQSYENKSKDRVESQILTRADLEQYGSQVIEVLDGLGLSQPLKRLQLQLSELSGGWRMRVALAQILCHIDSIDVLLLDEPTNHLDLPTISWLQDYLTHLHKIILFISHDRSFLEVVATDIIQFKDYQLYYFAGTYNDWLRNQNELLTRHQHAIDAKNRKEIHIQKSIDAAYTRGDDKMIKNKTKKLERAAFTRTLDGHKYKLFSLEKLDEKYIRMPEILETERERYQILKFAFPEIDPVSLRLATLTSPLLTLEKCQITYTGRMKPVLDNITLSLSLQSRVGIIGRNGKGKSTLMTTLAFADTVGRVHVPNIPHTKHTFTSNIAEHVSIHLTHSSSNNNHEIGLEVNSGTIWRHHNLRIGMISQHQIDILSTHLYDTPLTYLQSMMIHKTELELRVHLGAFGLTGNLALQPIGSLSGGQKARLSFAIVCTSHPHILFLDEPTNHLSLESIDALIHACQEYTGGLVIISHNKYFLSQVCNELYIIDNEGKFSIHKSTQSADSIVGTMTGTTDTNRYEFTQLLEACLQKQTIK